MSVYSSIVRPLVFALDPETAHHLAKPVLGSSTICRLFGSGPVEDKRLEVRMGNMAIPNPVGLAPGFDKDAEMIGGLSQLGFGYLVIGSVMPEPRPGNPRRRIVRIPGQEAVVNCLGLPGKGVDAFARNLARRAKTKVPVIASFGATRDEDFLRSFELLQPLADALEVNLRCANNREDSGTYQRPDGIEPVLTELTKRKNKPLRVKLDSYTDAERESRMALLERLIAHGIDGVSTPTNYLVPNADISMGRGNISGGVLFERTLQVVKEVYRASGGKIAIHARGGISTGAQAFAAIAAGASTVELLTSFIYQGWTVARTINAELLAMMDREGIRSIEEIRGSGADVRILAAA